MTIGFSRRPLLHGLSHLPTYFEVLKKSTTKDNGHDKSSKCCERQGYFLPAEQLKE